MKIFLFVFLFAFVCSFTGLFCSENTDATNYKIESDATNFSFSLPDNFEYNLGGNEIQLFKKKVVKYDENGDDYKKMIGFYAMGGIGAGLAVLFAFGALICAVYALIECFAASIVQRSIEISATILAYTSLGLLGALILIGVPFIIIGFALARFYKKRSIISNNIPQYKTNGFNNPEFAFSIPL